MDNKSSFNVNKYDKNVRSVIPFYDEIHSQIISLIQAYYGDEPLAVLDTGCGTGTLAVKAFEALQIVGMMLCDPSQNMLKEAKGKLKGFNCIFICKGSENLNFENCFDVVTAIQSHHYLDSKSRERAVKNCYHALKPGGIFICFENTAPFSETGKELMLKRLETYERNAGRSEDEIKQHSQRYDREFFPISVKEHFDLLENTGFKSRELLWHSYMQSGFYAIK